MTATGFLLGLPMLFSNAAFLAMGSVTAVGLNASCAPLPSPLAPMLPGYNALWVTVRHLVTLIAGWHALRSSK